MSPVCQRNEYLQKLMFEAVVVGSLLLPIQMVMESLPLPLMRDTYKKEVSIVLAGATFHLLAEASGMNEWYLTHGAVLMSCRDIFQASAQPAQCEQLWTQKVSYIL